MKIGNLHGRLVIITPDGVVDVATASDQRFDSDPQRVFERWREFRHWAETATFTAVRPLDYQELGPPVPRPSQVFAVGLNYQEHADESGFEAPSAIPPLFTKFPSCIAGPYDEVELPEGNTDWEVELVVAIGEPAWRIAAEDGWKHVAGITVGQDISERLLQFSMTPPQFSLGKSFPGFGPTGPVLVSPDELANPDDLAITCSVNGTIMQTGRTSQMIFSVGRLLEALSAATPLLPGDLVFTGTPSGVGIGRTPELYLAAGDELVSSIEGVGTLRNRFVPRRDGVAAPVVQEAFQS